MDQGPRDEDAALFAGGHFAHQLLGEMRSFDPSEGFDRAGTHFFGDVEIGPQS